MEKFYCDISYFIGLYGYYMQYGYTVLIDTKLR